MVATFPYRTTTALQAHQLNEDAMSPAACQFGNTVRQVAHPEPENILTQVHTWGIPCRVLERATVDVLQARRIAQQDYKKVQAEEERWEQQLQLAIEDDREDLVYKALLNRNACRDRARHLKALVERHSVQLSMLEI
jgi:hypothetical protein